MRYIIATAIVFTLGCGQPAQHPDLTPWVAVSGHYALLAAGAPPAPVTPAKGCVEGCRCNGTGREKSGDGIALVNCRCAESCPCKTKGAKPCPTGTCPPTATVR